MQVETIVAELQAERQGKEAALAEADQAKQKCVAAMGVQQQAQLTTLQSKLDEKDNELSQLQQELIDVKLDLQEYKSVETDDSTEPVLCQSQLRQSLEEKVVHLKLELEDATRVKCETLRANLTLQGEVVDLKTDVAALKEENQEKVEKLSQYKGCTLEFAR